MYYCEHCYGVFQQNQCPVCGRKKLKSAEPGDMCYLTEQKQVWAGMLQDLLRQNNIFYIAQPVLGAAMAFSVGQGLERYRIFVPFQDLAAAKEIMKEVLPRG